MAASIAGAWMGNPTAGYFQTVVFNLSQQGDAVTGSGTVWFSVTPGAANRTNPFSGNVTGNNFTLQSPSGDLEWSGTVGGADELSGQLSGQLTPGGSSTADLSCARIDAAIPNSITGQWASAGSEGQQTLSLSLLQSGNGVVGVGSAQVVLGSLGPVSIEGFVTGHVVFPFFALTLATVPKTWGQLSVSFIGAAENANTLGGAIVEALTPVALTRQS